MWSTLLVWMQNGTSTLDAFYILLHTIQQLCSLIFMQGVENLHPHKNQHTDVYNSFIHNCQNLEATKCPSIGEWINKLWYIQTIEYYLVLKSNKLSSHEKTWREFKCILLRERSQSEKPTYCMIPTLWPSGKGKTMETIEGLVVARDGVEES